MIKQSNPASVTDAVRIVKQGEKLAKLSSNVLDIVERSSTALSDLRSKIASRSTDIRSVDLDSLSSDSNKELVRTALYNILEDPRELSKEIEKHDATIDRVDISMVRSASTTDVFRVTVTYSFPVDLINAGSIRAATVARTLISSGSFTPNISYYGLSLLSSNVLRTRQKNDTVITSFSRTMKRTGVSDSVSVLNPIDPIDGVRLGSGARAVIGPMRQMPLQVGRGESLDSSDSGFVQATRPEMNEVCFVTPDISSAKIVGDRAYFTVSDDNVSLGQRYGFFVKTMDPDMEESRRSEIVEVTLDGLRFVNSPTVVLSHERSRGVTLCLSSEDPLVEKFEIYSRRSADELIPVVYRNDGLTVGMASSDVSVGGFNLIGESLNVTGAGGVFFDKSALAGKSAEYRIYAVDVFGNKSPEPTSVDIFVPDGLSYVDLSTPEIDVEIDKSTGFPIVHYTLGTGVGSAVVKRRDLTLGQSAFVDPATPAFIGSGRLDQIRNGRWPISTGLGSQEHDRTLWSGVVTAVSGTSMLLDSSVRPERVYQYTVYGMDRFGNQTDHIHSVPIFISGRPMVDGISDLRVHVVTGSSNGVSLSWSDPSSGPDPLKLMGNRETLVQNSVKSVYQVFRRIGSDRWRELTVTDEMEIFDPVERDDDISYKVQVFHSGGFISNVSEPVSILFDPAPVSVTSFSVTNPGTKVRPFYVILNWDQNDVTRVSSWEIEKCVINTIAASGIADITGLPYSRFRNVTRESGRSLGRSVDGLKRPLFVSTYGTVDFDVPFGNVVFYRIRTLSERGTTSEWSYVSVRVTDEVHDRITSTSVNRLERESLRTSLVRASFKDPLSFSDAFSTLSLRSRDG